MFTNKSEEKILKNDEADKTGSDNHFNNNKGPNLKEMNCIYII